MKNNLRNNVVAAIAKTQDGKKLDEKSDFSKFILSRIEAHTNFKSGDFDFVDLENLRSDFEYMIHELKKAIVPLNDYLNNRVW